jgi:hypothetical protein
MAAKPALIIDIFLHKLYYNISQLSVESLTTQKDQTFLRGFLTNFVLGL